MMARADSDSGIDRPFYGWRMVALAFLAYNCALGLTTGAFGTVLPALQHDLHASRAAASSGLGLMLLAVGVLSPIVGTILQRLSLRRVMITGTILTAIGFGLLARADELWEVLVLFAGLVGTGATLMGVICAPALVSRWFERDRGKALGIALMPAFVLIGPPVAAVLIEHGGRQLLFAGLSAVFVALVPVLLLVVDQPEDVGQQPLRAVDDAPTDGAPPPAEPLLRPRAIFSERCFWLLSLVIGILTAAGLAFLTHATSIAIGKGMDLTVASTLVSVYGFGTLFGALGFGWLIDRIGPFGALFVNVAAEAVLWLAFGQVSALPMMLAVSCIIGAGNGATMALHSAGMTRIFGTRNFSRAMGYSYFVKIPFLVGGGPLAGLLFDRTGSYSSTILIYSAALAFAACVAAILRMDPRSRETRSLAPAAA